MSMPASLQAWSGGPVALGPRNKPAWIPVVPARSEDQGFAGCRLPWIELWSPRVSFSTGVPFSRSQRSSEAKIDRLPKCGALLLGRHGSPRGRSLVTVLGLKRTASRRHGILSIAIANQECRTYAA